MQNEWQTTVLVTILQGKGDVRNRNVHRAVKLLENSTKIAKKSAGKKESRVNECWCNVIWFCARQRNNRRIVCVRMQKE